MELQSQRVWDYAGGQYVHRLLQNNVDGKMVEVGLPSGIDVDSLGGGRNSAWTSVDANAVVQAHP